MQIMYAKCFKKLYLVKVGAFALYSNQVYVIFVIRFERRKVDKKQTYPTWKLKHANSILEAFEYFWQPNVIKIDPYNFELYRFKVGAFFLRHSVVLFVVVEVVDLLVESAAVKWFSLENFPTSSCRDKEVLDIYF